MNKILVMAFVFALSNIESYALDPVAIGEKCANAGGQQEVQECITHYLKQGNDDEFTTRSKPLMPAGSEGNAPIPKTLPSLSAQSSDSPEKSDNDYTGEVCAYFTRPMVEKENAEGGLGVTRLNTYTDGSIVVYGESTYKCENRRWVKKGPKNLYSDWKKRRAEVIEKQKN